MNTVADLHAQYAGRSATILGERNRAPAYSKVVEHRTATFKRSHFTLTTRDDVFSGHAYANLSITPTDKLEKATLIMIRSGQQSIIELEACHSHRFLGTRCEFSLLSDGLCLPSSNDVLFTVLFDAPIGTVITVAYDVVAPIVLLSPSPYRFPCYFQQLAYLGRVTRPGEHKMKVDMRHCTTKAYFFLPPDAEQPVLILDHFFRIPLTPVKSWFEITFGIETMVDMGETESISLKFSTSSYDFECYAMSICMDRYFLHKDILTNSVWDKNI